jgi:FG-GAP-like repeat
MHNLFRILGIFTLITSLSAGIIANAAAPTKEAIRQTEQNELAITQPNGKKQLKKKLSLDYSNPKFESELNKSQKDAILSALKKWKLDLPVNNTFTVTSISDLKKNQKVVYMWAVTPNANWDNSKSFDIEDYEEGDPRFIRTEFNVLLKKSNGGWKATLEQDNELKTELSSIPESEVTTEEKNVLFGANKPENYFTDQNEVLIEVNTTNFSSSNSSISSVSSSSVTLSSQINSSSVNSVSTSSNKSTSSASSQTIGLLDVLFGTLKVSAAWETDYSWPWTSGQQFYAGQGWHDEGTYFGRNDNGTFYGTPNGINVDGKAIDLQPFNNASTDVLAPVSGVIQRSCVDPMQAHLKFPRMGILHIATSGLINATSVTKSQKIGSIFNPGNYYSGLCGTTYGTHLHIKILDNQVIDGNTFSYNTNYNPVPIPGTTNNSVQVFTSQNTPPTLPITDPNIIKVQPPVDNYNFALNSGCGITETNPVYISVRDNNSNCQKMRYNAGNNTITNPFGKCLDAGYPTQQLVFYPCNGSNNQKWKQENSTGRIWSFQRADNTNLVRCIEHTGLSNGNIVKVLPCNGNSGQKWFYDLSITQENIPTNAATFPNVNLYWRNVNGTNVRYVMNGETKIQDTTLNSVTTDWKIGAIADFNNDGNDDILWRNNNGSNVMWFLNSSGMYSSEGSVQFVDPSFDIVGAADFNNDGKSDLLWRNKNNGTNVIWYMNSNNHLSDGLPPQVSDLPFEIVGTGDYNRDGKADIFWRNRNTNENVIWYMNGSNILQSVSLGSNVGSNWGIAGTIDYNGDGNPDIIWRDKNNGQNTIWYMNNTTQIGALNIMSISTDWKLEVKN